MCCATEISPKLLNTASSCQWLPTTVPKKPPGVSSNDPDSTARPG